MASLDRKLIPFFITLDTPWSLTTTPTQFSITGMAALLAPYITAQGPFATAFVGRICTLGFIADDLGVGFGYAVYVPCGSLGQSITAGGQVNAIGTGTLGEISGANNLNAEVCWDYSGEFKIIMATSASTLKVTAVYGVLEAR